MQNEGILCVDGYLQANRIRTGASKIADRAAIGATGIEQVLSSFLLRFK